MIREKVNNKWKQINYRFVKTALSFEFLHELYNRHTPSVNSLRFHNTILVTEGNEIKSYAPQEEWDFIAFWLGERFIQGDKNLQKEIKKYITLPKKRLKEMFFKFKNTNFAESTKKELFLDLIELQYTSLSELYGINLVQLEHALNYAISKMLKKYFPDQIERNNTIVKLSFSKEPTIAVNEEREFYKIVLTEFKKDKKTKETPKKIIEHYENYKFIHSAYGTKPYELSYYLKRYNSLLKKGTTYLEQKINKIDESYKDSLKEKEKYLKKIKNDKILMQNVLLLEQIGTLRDKNKATLGKTTEYRETILNLISKKTNVSRNKLDWYFLFEIGALIEKNKLISEEIIKQRKKEMIITRNETLNYNVSKTKKLFENTNNTLNKINGTCASVGKYEGIAKIIRKSSDIKKFNEGDVMISPGTDFDLINIMQIAGAIITEEGGILSHAAVISRELNIPCLIDVNNATKIFKDGDKIFINTAKGIIERRI